jgi:hypothetical protein
MTSNLKYNCNLCCYTTDKKSDYDKHLKTKKHNKTSIKKINKNDLINSKINKCIYCGITYSRLDNLKRHESKCSKRIIIEKNKELQKQHDKLKKYEQELYYLKQIINLSEKKEDSSISKFKFINNNYKLANPLKKITYDEFTQVNEIKYIDNNSDNSLSYNDLLIEDILYCHRHNTLDSYIGASIVKMYKNFDPSRQSIWITDQSRLKYIIRTCDEKHNIYWTADKNGKYTNKYLVSPIIKEIKILLIEYQKNYCTPKKNVFYTFTTQEKMMQDSEDIFTIITNIDEKKLNKKILKYLSIEFSLDPNINTNTNTNTNINTNTNTNINTNTNTNINTNTNTDTDINTNTNTDTNTNTNTDTDTKTKTKN